MFTEMNKFLEINGVDGEKFWSDFRRKHQLAEIGNGACASVYKGQDCVFKVGPAGDNQAYIEYVKTILESGIDNPFLPKIFFAMVVDGFMIVALEQLKKNERYSFKKYIGVSHFDLEHIADRYARDRTCKEEDNIILSGADKFELLAALKIVSAAYRRTEETDEYVRFDMHEGNFMYRDGQMVITDPLVNGHI